MGPTPLNGAALLNAAPDPATIIVDQMFRTARIVRGREARVELLNGGHLDGDRIDVAAAAGPAGVTLAFVQLRLNGPGGPSLAIPITAVLALCAVPEADLPLRQPETGEGNVG